MPLAWGKSLRNSSFIVRWFAVVLFICLVGFSSSARADNWWSWHNSLGFGLSYLGGLGSGNAAYNLSFERQFGVSILQVGFGARTDLTIDIRKRSIPAYYAELFLHLTVYPSDESWSPFFGFETGLGFAKHSDFVSLYSAKSVGGRIGISVGQRQQERKHLQLGVRGSVLIETDLPETPLLFGFWIKIPF